MALINEGHLVPCIIITANNSDTFSYHHTQESATFCQFQAGDKLQPYHL